MNQPTQLALAVAAILMLGLPAWAGHVPPVGGTLGPTWLEGQLFADDADRLDKFGTSVAIDGDRIVVGAEGDREAGSMVGAAYIFDSDGAGGWSQVKILPSAAYPGGVFGRAGVAVDGDTVAVAATREAADWNNHPRVGYVYVYAPDGADGWQETHRIPGTAWLGFFGTDLDVEGTTLVASTMRSGGSVHIHDLGPDGAWTRTQTLVPDDPLVAGANFGMSLQLEGNRLLVGARVGDGVVAGAGAAYLFERDTAGVWQQIAKFQASDGEYADNYGFSVAMEGDRMLVGAYRDATALGDDTGSVYLYEPDGAGGWTETKFTASDGQPFAWYGKSVAFDGERLVVGAQLDDEHYEDGGAVYIYEPDGAGGWSETKMLPAYGSNVQLGASVAADNGRIVAGAPIDYPQGIAVAGTAYLYEHDGDRDGLIDAREVVGGCPDIAEPDSDRDGLTDGYDEGDAGTDPCLYDTDADGQGDGYELAHGTDPLDPASVNLPVLGPTLLPAPLPGPVPEW